MRCACRTGRPSFDLLVLIRSLDWIPCPSRVRRVTPGFDFNVVCYEEAEASGLPLLRRPAHDEIRIVSEPVYVEGDLDLEADGAEVFQGAWVFLDGLEVTGSIVGSDLEDGLVLWVRRRMSVGQWWLCGSQVWIEGELEVRRLLVAQYNHGELVVEGMGRFPLALILDHNTQFRGGTEGVVCEALSEAARHVERRYVSSSGEANLDELWSAAEAGTAFLQPVKEPVRSQQSVDPIYQLAHRLVMHWVDADHVVLDPMCDVEALIDELSRALPQFQCTNDPAAALGGWVMNHDAVVDVLVDDQALSSLKG